MKKESLVFAAFSACLMMAVPFCAVKLVPANAGMLVSVLLLFAVNPAAALASGFVSGVRFRERRFRPLLLTLFFLAGAWLAYEAGETDFLIYAAVYLVLGYAAAAVTVLARRNIVEE